jgi:hypothetical protein
MLKTYIHDMNLYSTALVTEKSTKEFFLRNQSNILQLLLLNKNLQKFLQELYLTNEFVQK